MSSQDIENMIYYCADNFAECDVYLNHRPSLQAPEGANRNFLTGPSQGPSEASLPPR